MIGEDLSRFHVFMYRLVEEPDHILRGAFIEYLAACYVAAVVIEDCDKPFRVDDLKIALPEAVRAPSLPARVGSSGSRLREWMVESFAA